MVINHVPANAPSHMRQTIGLESAAACTSMYDGSHPWTNDGPIFVVVREPIRITMSKIVFKAACCYYDCLRDPIRVGYWTISISVPCVVCEDRFFI